MSEYKTVAAYFPSQASAESAISALKTAGFQQSQIGVAAASSSSASPSMTSPASSSDAYAVGQHTGNAWEKVKGFFSGNSAEPYAGEASGETFDDNVITPEHVEPEDLHGSLTDLSVSDQHTRYFGHQLSTGAEGAVVTVNADGREREALEILAENGGDVGDNAEQFDYAAVTPGAAAVQKIQLFGEALRVHKDRVSRGEVRLRKEVITSTQTIEVPVTREELVVERVPVTGQQAATGASFQGEEIRIPLSEERVSVSKQAVVLEEVRIGKREVTNVETHDEEVRHEELKLDQDLKNTTTKA